MKAKCNGKHAQALRLDDRCFFCGNCRLCELSSQLPDWDGNAEQNETAQRIDDLFPYTLKIWIGEPNRPNIGQYAAVEEMIEDVCDMPYVAGLNGYGIEIKVLERGEVHGTMSHLRI